MEMKMVGEGAQYPWSVQDSKGNPFVVYDNQKRSMLQTHQQFPSMSSQNKGLKANADGSVMWFGKEFTFSDYNWKAVAMPSNGET